MAMADAGRHGPRTAVHRRSSPSHSWSAMVTPAAMIYLHSSDERQRRHADALGKLARAELRKTREQVGSGEASGTKVARRRREVGQSG
jgi:hypothetical protein